MKTIKNLQDEIKVLQDKVDEIKRHNELLYVGYAIDTEGRETYVLLGYMYEQDAIDTMETIFEGKSVTDVCVVTQSEYKFFHKWLCYKDAFIALNAIDDPLSKFMKNKAELLKVARESRIIATGDRNCKANIIDATNFPLCFTREII